MRANRVVAVIGVAVGLLTGAKSVLAQQSGYMEMKGSAGVLWEADNLSSAQTRGLGVELGAALGPRVSVFGDFGYHGMHETGPEWGDGYFEGGLGLRYLMSSIGQTSVPYLKLSLRGSGLGGDTWAGSDTQDSESIQWGLGGGLGGGVVTFFSETLALDLGVEARANHYFESGSSHFTGRAIVGLSVFPGREKSRASKAEKGKNKHPLYSGEAIGRVEEAKEKTSEGVFEKPIIMKKPEEEVVVEVTPSDPVEEIVIEYDDPDLGPQEYAEEIQYPQEALCTINRSLDYRTFMCREGKTFVREAKEAQGPEIRVLYPVGTRLHVLVNSETEERMFGQVLRVLRD